MNFHNDVFSSEYCAVANLQASRLNSKNLYFRVHYFEKYKIRQNHSTARVEVSLISYKDHI